MTARDLSLPPHSLEAERAVLGSILKDPTSMVDIGDMLQATDFYDARHRLIFSAMQGITHDGLPPDLAIVTDRLRQLDALERAGGWDALLDLDNAIATAAFVGHYAGVVRDTAMRRALISKAQAIAELAYREDGPVGDVLERAERLVGELRGRALPSGPRFAFVAPGELAEPAPRAFRWDPLLPEGAVTLLYGDAGLGKSFIAAALGIAIAAGLPRCLQMPIIGGRVLYVDAELDADEFTRRTYQLARGMGLEAPPMDLLYLNLEHSLATPRGRDWLKDAIADARADVTILDSLSFASAGAKLNDPGEMAAVLMGLRNIGTFLALDHSNWAGVQGNQSDSHPMGSFFKRAFSRSMIQIDQALAGGITLRANKATFGAIPQPVHLAIAHQSERTVVQRIDLHDGRMAGAERNMPAIERVHLHLVLNGPTQLDALVEAVDLRKQYVKNLLTALRTQGRAVPSGDAVWRCVQDAERTRNGTPPEALTETGFGVSPQVDDRTHPKLAIPVNHEPNGASDQWDAM
jgi:hypothetical protein